MIAARYGTSISALEKANNLTNRHKLSIGQVLLVPVAGSTSKDYAGNSRVTTKSPSTNYARSAKNHTVRRGDTPSEIAEAYGIPLSELYAANNMSRRSVIKVGQVLKIPGTESSTMETFTSSNSSSGVTVSSVAQSVGSYTVKQGDTPLHIAIEHSMTLNQFLELNSLGNSSVIYPGQSLKVYAAAGSAKSKISHTVKSGESLWTIARKYSVSISDLVYWNGYSSSNKTLHPGDKVTIITGDSGLTTQQNTQKSEIIHTVRSGESLYKIAGKYGVSIEEIKKWNGKNGSDLAIGEKLTIYIEKAETPKPSPTTGKQIVHKIKQGDTLWDIAQKYNVTTNAILSQNGIKDPTVLRVGDEIKIFIE